MRRQFYAFAAFIVLAAALALPAAVRAQAISIVVRVGVNINLPPYQYMDEDGTVNGLHIDIMDAIAGRTGLVVEYVPYQNTYDAMQAMQDNALDAVLGVPSGKYGGAPAIYSDDINTTSLCLMAANGVAEEYNASGRNARVVVALESDVIDYNHMNSMNFLSAVLRDNQVSAYEALRGGYADMLVGVKDSVIFLLRQDGIEDEYSIITNHMATVSYSIAAHREDHYLITLINRALAELQTTGEYEALAEHWSMVDDNSAIVTQLIRVLVAFGTVIIAIAVYFIITLRIKRMLEKEVALRTQDLNSANEKVRVMNAQLQQKILQREEYSRLLDSIIEATPTAMLLLDHNGAIMHGNRHADQLAGLLQGGAGAEGGEATLRQVIENCMDPSAPPGHTGSIMAAHPGGQQRTLRYSVHRLMEDGALPRLLITMEDVTAETIEQDAKFEKRKNIALNNMIASIAHEVKNPLTTISAAIDMVYAKRNDLAFMEAFREVVPQEVERINRLVKNLVYYARPPKSASERLDMGRLVLTLKRMAEPLAERSGTLLDFECEAGLFVLASRDKLTQVLLNFVMNSLESIAAKLADEAAGYSPCLRVRARRLKQFVSVAVWDNGTGMSEQQAKTCTQPFYSTKAAGTGLGLPVSAQYISEIGGTLQIDSRLGEYAQVTMFLPALDTPSPQKPAFPRRY